MTSRANLRRGALILCILILATSVLSFAGKTTPATITLYNGIVDEQNTSAFYGNQSCLGSSTVLYGAGLSGDGLVNGPNVAYNCGLPWTMSDTVLSTSYDQSKNSTNCNANGTCVVSALVENNATINLNTRTTPRAIAFNFDTPCNGCSGFNNLALPSYMTGGTKSTSQAKFSVFAPVSLTSMAVCSSTACPEAEIAYMNLWFDDWTTPLLSWKVAWGRVRVLRMTSTLWYVVADMCDGTSTAAVYRTENQRGGKTSFRGYWIMPTLITVSTQ